LTLLADKKGIWTVKPAPKLDEFK